MNKIHLSAPSPPSGWLLRGMRRRARGRNYLNPELKIRNFSKDEDELILKLHALLGNRWSLIAGRLPGRTDKEVMIHWETYLKRKLMKMGIDPTNHRLHHHTHYMTRRYLNSLHKQHETNIISVHSSSSSSSSSASSSSSVSESCDTTISPISSTNYSEVSTSLRQSRLPDLNIGPTTNMTVTSLPARYHQDSSESSNHGSTGQETLLLFR